MRSRNMFNRLEKHYYVQLEDGVTQWVNKDAIKELCNILFNQCNTLLYCDFYC